MTGDDSPSPHAQQFPQLSRGFARNRREDHRAGRAERRRQDQFDRGHFLLRAGPRPAPRQSRRGGVQRRRRLVGGRGRDRRRARPCHAGHRHRAAARRRRNDFAQMPDRPRAGRLGRGLRRSSARGVAGAGHGHAVCRRPVRAPALSRPARARGRCRARQPRQRAGTLAAFAQPAARGGAARYPLAGRRRARDRGTRRRGRRTARRDGAPARRRAGEPHGLRHFRRRRSRSTAGWKS